MTKEKNVKFLVLYSVKATPHVRQFKSKAAATRFVKQFLYENQENLVDNWVDMVIEGKIHSLQAGAEGMVIL